MAEIIRYVDPDAVGGGSGLDWTNAYVSLNAWEAAEGQNLTDGGGDWMHVYVRASSGTDDTTPFTIASWETGVSNYILIEAADGDQAVVSGFDDSRYVLHNNDSGTYTISQQENYVRFVGLQIKVTGTSTNTRHGVYVSAVPSGGSDIRIDSCRITGVHSGTGVSYGIWNNDPDATVNVFNTIVENFVSGGDSGFRGVQAGTNSTINIYNSNIYNSYTGLAGAAITAENAAIFNNTDDVNASTCDYCASDDEDGDNSQKLDSTDNYVNEFVDAPSGDFTLVEGSVCIDNGTDDPSHTGCTSQSCHGDDRFNCCGRWC